MKKSLLIASLFTASFAFGQADSLVASYNFNASRAVDASGMASTGILTNVTGELDRDSQTYSAVSFNGSSSTIRVGSTSNLVFTTGFTISAWINPNTLSGQHAIVSKWATAVNSDQYILMQNGNRLIFAVGKPGVSANGYTSNGTIPSNQWTHVAATWDTSGAHKIYINGVLDFSIVDPAFTSTNSTSTTQFHMGSQLGTSRFFSGALDNIKVFRQALDASEISTLYNEPTEIENSLISKFPFDNSTTDVISGNNPLPTGITYVDDRNSNPNSAINIDPINSYINFFDSYDWQATNVSGGKISYSFWLNFNQLNNAYQIILAKSADGGCSGNDREFMFRINANNKLEITSYGTASAGNYLVQEGSSTLTAGSWNHIVLIYDNSQSGGAKWKLYLNNNQETLSQINILGGGIVNGFSDANAPLALGAYMLANGSLCQNVQRLNAKFDDFYVYGKVLSASEVNQLFNGQDATGLNNIVSTNNVKAYPNPFDNKLKIENTSGAKQSVKLVNVNGAIVYQNEFAGSELEINTEELPAGIYFIQIDSANGRAIKKVVKM